jgi:ligand-binding SRPBCC domain-containing protein
MITIKVTQIIHQPIEEVYAFLACYENDIHWRTGVKQMRQDRPGLAQAGMITHEVMHFMGRKAVTVARITAAEQYQRTAFCSVEGPVKAWGQRLFESSGNGTRFTYQLNLEPAGLMRLLSPLVQIMFQHQLQKDITRLKRFLEEPLTRATASQARPV